jgi:2-polyprenyl-3-methyl-5-hydroxy-6-metoxy-1,4-benzoquinol methylase
VSEPADRAAASEAVRAPSPSPCPACAAEATVPHAIARDVEYGSSDRAYAYRRCAACGAIFIDPPPVDRLAEIYPSTYYSFRASGDASLTQRIKERLDARLFRRLLRDLRGPTLRVLDVGGGTGWLLSVVRRADPRVVATHEVDLDDSARAAAEAAGHVFHCTPIERFASDERFDLVLMLNVIEHVADPVAVLRVVAGLLAPGGRILIKTPNTATLDHRLFRHRNWGGYHCPRHWVLFTAENFTATARRAGLAPVWIRYTQGAPQWTPSLLGLLVERGWLQVSPQRPMYTHPLFTPLMALTSALDFVRLAFMKTAQMFVLLGHADAGSSAAPPAAGDGGHSAIA